jgi:hypothetical protein
MRLLPSLYEPIGCSWGPGFANSAGKAGLGYSPIEGYMGSGDGGLLYLRFRSGYGD